MIKRMFNSLILNDSRKIPPIGYGVFKIPNSDVKSLINDALGIGYRLIDTASIYGNEVGVGEALSETQFSREQLFITTKVWNNDQGWELTEKSCLASLSKLGLEYLDLVLIHWPVPSRGLFIDTWKCLIKLQSLGLIKSIGVSNFSQDLIEQLANETGVIPTVNQIELHPLLQQYDLVDFHNKYGICTQAWSPLGRGQLLIDDRIVDEANLYNVSPSKLILCWHMQRGIIPLPKSIHKSRMIDNFSSILTDLPIVDLSSLDNGTRFGPDPLDIQ